jgi:hypothetical protein
MALFAPQDPDFFEQADEPREKAEIWVIIDRDSVKGKKD